MGILLYGSDFIVENEEFDLELDKLIPLLVSVDEENDPVPDEDFLKYLDGISLDDDPQPAESAADELPELDLPTSTEEQTISAEQVHESQQTEKENPPQKKENSLLIYLHDLVYFLAALLIASIFFRVVVVSGDSMYNTLVDGDYLLIVSNVLYRDPQPGDVIVASKDSFRNGEAIVKRVIATEGQEIDIDFSTGSVYVDGKLIEEPYIYSATTDSEGMTFPLVVGEGCLFVMGDNRAVSMDSRDPQIGLIDCREVVGKAILLIFPGNNKDKSERQLYRIGVIG